MSEYIFVPREPLNYKDILQMVNIFETDYYISVITHTQKDHNWDQSLDVTKTLVGSGYCTEVIYNRPFQRFVELGS